MPTDRCWKSHALKMFVATLGKIPLFLLFLLSRSDSSSSPVLGEVMAPSKPSPVASRMKAGLFYKRHVPISNAASGFRLWHLCLTLIFEPFSVHVPVSLQLSAVLSEGRPQVPGVPRGVVAHSSGSRSHDAFCRRTAERLGRLKLGEGESPAGEGAQVCQTVSPVLTGWNRSR